MTSNRTNILFSSRLPTCAPPFAFLYVYTALSLPLSLSLSLRPFFFGSSTTQSRVPKVSEGVCVSHTTYKYQYAKRWRTRGRVVYNFPREIIYTHEDRRKEKKTTDLHTVPLLCFGSSTPARSKSLSRLRVNSSKSCGFRCCCCCRIWYLDWI